MMYEITRKYVTNKNARPGYKNDVKFIVAHDTGNAGARAYPNHYNYFQNITFSASAHTFIDDKYIIEIIPLDEKAWHVRYDKDTKALGKGFANDYAIGVELCYGGSIDFKEAYKRYVWYHAYLCEQYGLSVKDIVGHETLDPGRKTDPSNALNKNGITFKQFIEDVEKELKKEEKNVIELTPGLQKAKDKLVEYGIMAADYELKTSDQVMMLSMMAALVRKIEDGELKNK